MAGKGFLVRGTLMPQMGSTTGYKEQGKTAQSFPVRRVVKRKSSSVSPNRIPSSITLRRNNGA